LEQPIVRILSRSDWQTYKRLRLQSLADSADAFARTVAEEVNRTDAEWADRLSSDDGSGLNLPLVAEVAGQAVGLTWGRITKASADRAWVYQMWVAPALRGQGIGRALLDAVIAWASEKGAASIDLGVTCGDTPARRLYENARFKPIGEPEALRPGSKLLAQQMRLLLKD
jgi:GNAT superfamily N-acetyltransferase